MLFYSIKFYPLNACICYVWDQYLTLTFVLTWFLNRESILCRPGMYEATPLLEVCVGFLLLCITHSHIWLRDMAKVNLIFFLFVVLQICVNFPCWRFWCFSWSTVKLLTFNNRINSRKPLKRNGSCKGGFTYVYLKKPWFFLLFWNGKVGHCLKCVLLFLDEKMGILESMNKDTRLLIFNRYDRK